MKNLVHRADCLGEKTGCVTCERVAHEESLSKIRLGFAILCQMVTEKQWKFTNKDKRAVNQACKELGLP